MPKNKTWLMLLVSFVLTITVILPASPTLSSSISIRDYWPTLGWRTLPPEAQGMNSTVLNELWNHINGAEGIQGFLLIRNGYLLYEGYAPGLSPNHLWRIYSATKSFSATMLGLAIADGHVTSVNDLVLDYFPERSYENHDPRKEAMTIWHLLTMSSGLERSDFGMGASSDWVQYLLDSPMSHEPGEQWNYNGGCSHLISAIISETLGVSMATFADNRLFRPMGISLYEWPSDPQGVTMGFSGLLLTLRDLAKLGFLYLNNGTWGANQLIPSEWVADCIYPHFLFGNGEGYGYQWWVDPAISGYSIRGAGGIRVFVLPQEDIILVFAGAIDYSSLEYYLLFDEFLSTAIIGDTTNYIQSPLAQSLPFLLGVIILIIPIGIGLALKKWRKTP